MKALALFDALVSRGQLQMDTVSRGQLRAAIIEAEATATDGVALADKRNRRRLLDKERQRRMRARHADKNQTPTLLILEVDSESQKERKRMSKNQSGDLFGNLPQVADDWPDDWEDQFWGKWPRSDRKVARKQVLAWLGRVRRRKEATWAQVWGGLCAYLATNPDPAWMPLVATWVNQARWEADYDVITSRSSAIKPAPARGFGAVAFGRR